MNAEEGSARRYHWHSGTAKDLINEPHSGIASPIALSHVLDLTAQKSEENRTIATELIQQNFWGLYRDIQLLARHRGRGIAARTIETPVSQMAKVIGPGGQLKLLNLESVEFRHHSVEQELFLKHKHLQKILWELCDQKPEDYKALLMTPGVGAKTLRALALVAEVIYGAKPSYEDPARYSFAHGGKDATPYPVDRNTYDTTIVAMRRYVQKAAVPLLEKRKMFARLAR